MYKLKQEVFNKLLPTLKHISNEYHDLEENTDHTILNAEETYEYNMLYRIHNHLGEAIKLIEQMNKPLKSEGLLYKNHNDRYEVNGYELTSGSPIEIWLEREGIGYWYYTRIEHRNGNYYAVDLDEELAGKKVRIK